MIVSHSLAAAHTLRFGRYDDHLIGTNFLIESGCGNLFTNMRCNILLISDQCQS